MKNGHPERARHREVAPAILAKSNVPFVVCRPDNSMLRVVGAISFYPGTGLWVDYGRGIRARGIRPLIQYVQSVYPSALKDEG